MTTGFCTQISGIKLETQFLAVLILIVDLEVNICPREVFAVTPFTYICMYSLYTEYSFAVYAEYSFSACTLSSEFFFNVYTEFCFNVYTEYSFAVYTEYSLPVYT